MKINKILVEDVNDEIVDLTAGVDEIADDIIDTAEEHSDGEITIPEDEAEKAAREMSDLGKMVQAEQGLYLPAAENENDSLGTDNSITRLLDRALEYAQNSKFEQSHSIGNVLISGLPGSGKTAIVYDWAKARGLNLVYINAKDNDLEAFINGFTVRDDENRKQVTKAYSNALDKLKEPNTVIFLDELNRQTKDQVRGALLTLINEHAIQGEGKDGRYVFNTILFTIACINPQIGTDKGAAKLFQAEKTRYLYKMKHADSDPATTDDYLLKLYDKAIRRLNPKHPRYREILEKFLRIQHLGRFMVNHRLFEYDGEDDVRERDYEDDDIFNQRMFTEILKESGGQVDRFREYLDYYSDFGDDVTDTLRNILDAYRVPSFDELCREKGIDPNSPDLIPPKADTPETEPDNASDTTEKSDDDFDFDAYSEDDDDFFSNAGTSTGTTFAASPTQVKDRIKAAAANW